MNDKKTFEQLLNEYGSFLYPCAGNSMLPLLRPGRDVVEICKVDAERYRKYDVVLYKRGDLYILHRILRVGEKDYVIAGDHNFQLEYGISDDQILGRVRTIIRGNKKVAVSNLGYKLYVHIWCDFYPVRAFLLRARMLSIKIIRNITVM